MRNIAHHLLRYAGDSTTGKLPLKRISDMEYVIDISVPFAFATDSIVQIINTVIQQNEYKKHCVVTVKNCETNETAYAYAFLETPQQSIIPCNGRVHPVNHYCVHILLDAPPNSKPNFLLFSAIGIIGAGLIFFGYKKRRQNLQQQPKPKQTVEESVTTVGHETPKDQPVNGIPLGNFIFNRNEQFLELSGTKIFLTQKEARILGIFAENINITVERNQLQKEVWEDEGVIVGRSLDMFISKLRKKLEADPTVKLTNIHSKGYKLEIFTSFPHEVSKA